jgi:ABC-type transport system involved in multi-copper enzyme maturation permease subunit
VSLPSSVGTVVRFELRRSWTLPRLAVWVGLVLFPVLIIGLLRYGSGFPNNPPYYWSIVLYGLIPEATCLAGLLLWMSPAVHTELERKTWVYLAVRPSGRRSLLLGKYVTSLIWTISAAWVALLIAVPLASPPAAWRTWAVLSMLVVLSCLGRGAIYALLSVIIPSRAMVFAVVYTMIFEFLVGLIPALINQFTVQLRLRSLLVLWMDWSDTLPETSRLLFDESSTAQHLILLTIHIIIALSLAIFVLEQRQFAASDEG